MPAFAIKLNGHLYDMLFRLCESNSCVHIPIDSLRINYRKRLEIYSGYCCHCAI